ncbi:flagellar hook protein FlgE [Phreatobacter oligotrophus]|jgi:flagellar hook protein FlgE|uniref:flagellar hook protein FlgE n=1 Tax=Phreatobacter oligotrophus TaxID=1122261 RepID=UPI0023537CAC|nr:flagellar hook protein FlgE [Phreatobacter oligotrophus]MBX9993012.1 flagellar hook protein FlgE [Phreatobacter oligotrophus]
MGIFGAMTTAVSGLSAQAYALENISGNIANSQTTAFKRIETAFVDLIPDSGPKRELSGSVTGYSRATNTIQGQISATSITTNLAINGDGYFVVQQPSGFVDGQPTFATTNAYTRRGDFTVDANGYMVNGAGYYLRGLPLDRTTGNPLGSSPVPIQITNDVIPARATDKIKYRASLPTVPKTAQANATAGSELMDSGLIGDATINSTDAPNFVATSVSGGSITAFDSLGNEVNVQIRWAKTANAAAGPPPVSDTWSAYYQSNSTSGAETWTRIGGDFTFSSTGQLTSPTSSPTIPNLTVNGTNVGNVELDIGTNGLSQYARADGTVQVTDIGQNGYAVGELMNVTITDTGRVRGNYSNGQSVDLFSIPLASFNGDNMLKRLDGGAFAETSGSGPAILGASGRIVSQSLEGSNVDISEEFTKLIITQQAYAANTRIVTTSNSMLQETINMIR